jgi:hypothetical protein
MGERDVDAEFADIIAHWDEVETLPDSPATTSTDAAPSEAAPTTTDGSDTPRTDIPRTDPAPRGPTSTDPVASGSTPTVNPPPRTPPNPVNPPPVGPFVVWRSADQPPPSVEAPDVADDPHELSDGDDEHFEPGPTAPLPPQEDLQFWGIIVGLVAGPLLLLWLVIFRPDVSDWWTLGALGLTVGGFVLLVMRQPHSRDEDDPDNGARV